jgi:hypothetical protein
VRQVRYIITAIVFFLLEFVSLRQFDPDGIVFYQGLYLAAVISVLAWPIFRYLKVQSPFKDSLLTFFIIYGFVFTVPTTVDRAYSVYLINKLGKSPATRAELEEYFENEFIANGGVGKRLTEQSATGTIRLKDGRYELTAFGQVVNGSFRIAQQLFACRGV